MIRKVILFFTLLSVPSFSQEEIVATEVVSLAIDEPVSGLFFHNGKEIATMQANLTGLGEPLVYKGPRRMIFRNSEAEFTAKPPLPLPAATVDLPMNADRTLLLFIKTEGQPLKTVAYDIGRGKSRAGDYRFFNFSHSVVSVIFGEKKFAIRPGTDSLVSDSSWQRDVLEIDMEIAIVKDGAAKSVYESSWGHRPGRRSYVFLFDGPQAYKPIRICRFFDVPSAAKTDPP